MAGIARAVVWSWHNHTEDRNLMRLLPLLTLAFTLSLHADFSYKSTRTTGGAMAAMMGNRPPAVSTNYYKGERMKIDNGSTATIVDFGAQTITTINHTAKTVSVKSFQNGANAGGSNVEAKIDVKETGQKKNVNGFDASEVVMTMDVENSQTPQMGKMQMEMHMWVSRDVPGGDQLFAFYQKNAANFPWTSMAGGGNPSMTAAIADAQRKMATIHGVPVQQIISMKPAGGAAAAAPPAPPAMSSAQSAQMDKARAQLQAMAASGGPQAAMAQQALARMGAIGGGGAPPAAGAPMIEITMDASDFSSAGIPDSVFAIPADYQKTN